MVIGSFLENGFEAPLSSKRNVLSVWKEHFQFFANFWLTKLKPFPGKVRQGVQNYLNQNLVTGSFFKNGFEATLSWKTNVLSVWKGHFSVFYNFLSKAVETIFWESEAKCSKYLNQNLVIRSLLENGFEAPLSSKTNALSIWKEHFQFFANFWLTKLKPFSGKVRQGVQNYLNQNLVIGSFFKNGFEATLSWKTNVLSIWKGHFSIFCKFLSDEVETIFLEREAKRSKLFKLKFDHNELLRKWFLKLPEAPYH